MLRIEAQVNSKNKTFTTHLAMTRGTRFLCPEFDDKDYLLVPKGVVLYYPFNYRNSDEVYTSAKWLRADRNFEKNWDDKHKGWYQHSSIGRDTYSPRLDLYNKSELGDIDIRFFLDEWANHNLYRHLDDYHYRHYEYRQEDPNFMFIWNQISFLEDKGFEYIFYTDDNTEITRPTVYKNQDCHDFVLSKIKQPTDIVDIGHYLNEKNWMEVKNEL